MVRGSESQSSSGGLGGYRPIASAGSSEQTVPAWVPTNLQGPGAFTRSDLLEGFRVCAVHLTTLRPTHCRV